MTNFTNKIVAATATVAILAYGLAPLASADTTITVSGNGEQSVSQANVTNVSSTNVTQSNNASINNSVSGSANTGGNSAVSNTGGSVSVTTGNASVNNTVSNQANQNYANVGCNCDNGNTTVKISGNGEMSNNSVGLTNVNATNVSQGNNAAFGNSVSGSANSGGNNVDGNTGGNVSVTTGNAKVSNNVSNWANGNSATVGGNGGNGGNTSLTISGNGELSVNHISVTDTESASVAQANNAEFENQVGGYANSGDNTAVSNTGGTVSITTGNASVNNSVDNSANFNVADLNCGCTTGDLSVTVSGNGEKSNNSVAGTFVGAQELAQANAAAFDNLLDCLFANSGNNNADGNTAASVYGDPSVTTGAASTSSNVSNTANLNSDGGNLPSWPVWDMGGVHVSVNFSLSALLNALGV